MLKSWLTQKSQNTTSEKVTPYPLQITPTVLQNLLKGVKNKKQTEQAILYSDVYTFIFIGTIRFILDDWNSTSEQILSKVISLNIKADENDVEVVFDSENEDIKYAVQQDEDDVNYEDMHAAADKQISNLNENKCDINVQDKLNFNQLFVDLFSYFEPTFVKLSKKIDEQSEQTNDINYATLSHKALEIILIKLDDRKIQEPTIGYITLASEFRPIQFQNVINIMNILRKFGDGSGMYFTLQYLYQVLVGKAEIVSLQWKQLYLPILQFIEEVYSECLKFKYDQNPNSIQYVYLSGRILNRWVVETKKVLGNQQTCNLLIESGITRNLSQLMINYGNYSSSEPIWYSVLVAVSAGKDVIDWLIKVPKFIQQINSNIFENEEGEGKVYGFVWGLVFRKELDRIRDVINVVYSVGEKEGCDNNLRRLLNMLRLLVVIKDIARVRIGQELKECEKRMRVEKRQTESSSLDEVDTRSECLRYLKELNLLEGKQD
eukprot:TRINITY_DN609_c0_g1_i2.p1 TRINITY_DN609_c0_g1~~TRINITY_DN609_c0_g1_i2.p1  ORF type:complete len:537 (-),score=72.37 TRINITY_DN609_c0_g1_i2:57-1526(-)